MSGRIHPPKKSNSNLGRWSGKLTLLYLTYLSPIIKLPLKFISEVKEIFFLFFSVRCLKSLQFSKEIHLNKNIENKPKKKYKVSCWWSCYWVWKLSRKTLSCFPSIRETVLTQNFLWPDVQSFPTLTKSLTPARCPTVQLNSDTVYLESPQTPQVKGSSPHDCPLPHILQMPIASPGCHLRWQPAINRGSQGPLQGFDNLLEWFTELKEPLCLLAYHIKKKNMIKYTGENPDKKMPRARSGERLQSPCALFNPTPVPTPQVRDFIEASTHRYD